APAEETFVPFPPPRAEKTHPTPPRQRGRPALARRLHVGRFPWGKRPAYPTSRYRWLAYAGNADVEVGGVYLHEAGNEKVAAAIDEHVVGPVVPLAAQVEGDF